jgi:hypothetical protein
MRGGCIAYLILLDLIILTIFSEKYKLWNSLLYYFLQPPIISSFFGSYILLSTLFWNTLSLHSSIDFRDQVSHPCKVTGKVRVLYILIFTCSDTRWEE